MATNIVRMSEQYGTGLADAHSGGGAKMNELIDSHNNMKSGEATILTGNNDVTVPAATIGEPLEDSPAFATLGFIDATATQVLSCVWSGDDLVITANANATADTIVFWFVDGRL